MVFCLGCTGYELHFSGTLAFLTHCKVAHMSVGVLLENDSGIAHVTIRICICLNYHGGMALISAVFVRMGMAAFLLFGRVNEQ